MATKNLEEILEYIKGTFGYEITTENKTQIMDEVKAIMDADKRNESLAFIAVMAVILRRKVPQRTLRKRASELKNALKLRNIEVDGALKNQLTLLSEYDLLRYNISEQLTNVISGKPPDEFIKNLDKELINSAKAGRKFNDFEFEGVKGPKIQNYKKALSSYFEYKARLYASNRAPSIEPDYAFYHKLFTKKLDKIKISEQMSEEEMLQAQKAILQAIHSLNRLNRFDLFYRNAYDKLQDEETPETAKGIYAARAAADDDCKAHQAVVMTLAQYLKIYPVHVNCCCTWERIPETYSAGKILMNTLQEDGTIPKTADIYRKAGTSRYPKEENIGKEVDNKYKFKYKETPKSRKNNQLKGDLKYVYTEPNSFHSNSFFYNTTRDDYYKFTRKK